MRNLKVWVEAEIHPSADSLADVFWAMDAEEQAFFFNRLGKISEGRLPIQLQQVADNEYLDRDGRNAMTRIGEYGEAADLNKQPGESA